VRIGCKSCLYYRIFQAIPINKINRLRFSNESPLRHQVIKGQGVKVLPLFFYRVGYGWGYTVEPMGWTVIFSSESGSIDPDDW